MGMTITEKILAAHAGKDSVAPGELIEARVDLVLGNDITAPIAIKEFRELGIDAVFDREAVALIPDHFTPNKDIKSAEQVKILREFAREFGIVHFYDVGRVGVEHALLPELGLTRPGMLIIGADSHTCTYGAMGAFSTGVGSTDMAAAMATGKAWFKVPESIKFVYEGALNPYVNGKDLILHTIGDIGVDGALYKAMEFTGEAVAQLSLEGRLTMANMAIEAGGKNGIFAPDDKTVAYVKSRSSKPYTVYASDPDARYAELREYDVSRIEPLVAYPHLPENVRPARESGIVIDQVVIGSCTNGRIEDLREAAAILKNRKVNGNVRLIIIPATQEIYRRAMEEGLLDIFVAAEAAVSAPTCGPCLGGHMGILAEGERCLATTNRNFVGRMGHPKSEVYLAGPAVAAASAVLGRIAHPDELK
ncbi:MAG TPA: 3-isopropylmalate dehydratase large subunit [Spirochaetota bacterium]|nr:3-isopropylmalate dehydratase large subunit [Spirochaetota bacterium]OPZ38165.1 MAG: 2,3-dimethylmalate dehydratase large subunit [Spirochaetes bacterium ADurb.BinA120]HPI14692.1 3-isopropylmalate dehydratase large subunit [Spirochaetota bacterium]HPO44975.1 3-isopropylmalate dehydratase large subunit [Spirochaetota bacterium]HPV96317.1 3-isopropylmalate dehydratase large subunit [Spirochaetota bacterium]